MKPFKEEKDKRKSNNINQQMNNNQYNSNNYINQNNKGIFIFIIKIKLII